MAGQIRFAVNGTDVVVKTKASTPLLFVLRNDLGLRGTRQGCGEGECGACTILVNGRPTTSCNTPVEAVADAKIETVESLMTDSGDHPLLEAIVAEQAGQCGYCLAGILMRAKALLANNASPSRSDLASALDQSLCRCGTHNRIMRAIMAAGQIMAAGGDK
ncbi:MAG: (2Fe-2S)-binding protein [Hyphomicrobiaceae bacterium]